MRRLLSVSIIFFALFIFTIPVSAAEFEIPTFRDRNYAGKYVSQSIADPIAIEAGAIKEVVVKIKNTGKTTWKATGVNYVSVYTVDPNYRASVFYDPDNWVHNEPVKLKADTKPGAVGEFRIKLKAPTKLGDYTERFYLVSENHTWIQGSYFFFKIKVTKNINAPVTGFTKTLSVGMTDSAVAELQKFLKNLGYFDHPSITNYFGPVTKAALIQYQKDNKLSLTGVLGVATREKINAVIKNNNTAASDDSNDGGNSAGETEVAADTGEYVSHLLAFSSHSLEIAHGGDDTNFIVRYTNDGTKEWTKYIWQEAGSTALDSSSAPNISSPSWQSRKLIASGSNVIKPGDPLEFSFSFRAPRLAGNYILRFQLMANDHTTTGGTLELPVKVLADAPSDYQETVWQTARTLIGEPNIRVGLYKTNDEVKFRANFRYEVFADDTTKGWLEPNDAATLSYSQGVYHFVGGALEFSGHGFIRLVPSDKEAYFTLTNYDREVSWKGNKNFNAYRGVLEYVYSPKSGMPYIINELPLDAYIAGIGETSNGAAMEYIKAILVAARSYAYKNIQASVSSAKPSFDVFPTTVDQLYLGYNSEVLMPRVVQAAQATYGEMVTYDGNPVTTPYFGNSNGKTRGWQEVWGGTDKPWLQPVDCIYDVGKSMFGHGVGMSAYDASRRAAEDGWTYDQILKYYYTDVEVERIY
jgi:peptidoglycan hydrolase-like protein with peptidoglycan-binding domain